jgi:branched-chain amino acid transport system substrate-binding protein
VNLAVDEINAAGGIMGRKIELIAEDSVNPQTASTKAEHLEKGAKFDILEAREGYYRAWDHQRMREMYTITFKSAAEVKNQWDLFTQSAPVPAASQSLEVIAPTREGNNCTMPA